MKRHADSHATVVKRLVAAQIERCMKREGLSKPAMARRMGTSRSRLERVLDPNCIAVQLDILVRAARAVGRNVAVSFHPRATHSRR